MLMDPRQLEYVVAVADEGSFTSAARSLHVSQPALSQSIAALEAEVGVPLFDRLGRTVRLTSAGEALLSPARQVLHDLELARASVDDSVSLRSGRLVLVALPTLAVDPLAGLVGEFRKQHPGVVVDIALPEDDEALVGRLKSGASELAFTELPVRGEGLASFELDRHDYVAALPPGQVVQGRTVSLKALAHLPLVVTRRGTSSRRLIEEAFVGAELEPTIAVVTDHREMLLPLVLAGAGAALLPMSLAEMAEARGAIVRAVRPAITRRVGVVWRSGPVSPAAAALLRLAGVDHVEAGPGPVVSRPRPRRRRH
jgi:LysR family carnitine catabolism transcriptional activator